MIKIDSFHHFTLTGKGHLLMSDNSNIRSPYPYNLFKDVKGNSTITLPESLSSDTLSGLHYVLSGLSDTEQLFIQLFYKEGFSAEETSAKLNLSLDQFKTTQDVLLLHGSFV